MLVYLYNTQLKNTHVLVYMYYMHLGYQTSIFGKNCTYYIGIFTVCKVCVCMGDVLQLTLQ